LTYRDAQNREEVLEGLVPPVELEHALAARRAAWYLVNLTSGRDLTLATLQGLRAQWKGTLQLDIHSLTLDILPGGRRALRCPPDWQDWVRCVDWVQVNETEALLLGEGTECAAFARALLELGPQGAIVTLGERGCLAAWRTAGRIEVGEWPAATHPAVPFPTGCGDVFGATFAYAMLQGGDPGRAVELANGVASTKACYEPQAAIAALRDHAAPHLQRFARPLD
jgi:hypothetical protein